MQTPKAIHVSPNRIVALYEHESGERVAHEHLRLGAKPTRRGTWRRDGEGYQLTFGTDTERINAITVDELQATPVDAIPAFRRDIDLRIEKHFGKSA